VFDFVCEVLLTTAAEGKAEAYRERVIRFAMKFQQYTGPVMAKGMEDTAFYRYHRLVSLNEVGGEPDRPGRSVADFHRACLRRREHWPHAMLSGSTHDSKRSEDVRARLHLLSEMPDEWRAHLERWPGTTTASRPRAAGTACRTRTPSTCSTRPWLGVWPLEHPDAAGLAELRERVGAYMEKAVKEAKVHTAWTNPDQGYEAALAAFVTRHPDGARAQRRLLRGLPAPFVRRLARLGLYNSLSATLLRLTAPGVPDVYQGTELWDFSLVDPDNRRPVDFERRRALLADLRARFGPDADTPAELRGLTERIEDGAAKLFLIWRALALRRRHPALFEQGTYVPLQVQGPHRERLCAFARVYGEQVAIALAPRLPAGGGVADPFADGGWSATSVAVPGGTLVDVLTGEPIPAAELGGDPFTLPAGTLLRRFPVGLLASEDLYHG
jgi:(1->4)-alpha-D-glucan 1-alpha-D-glucosylmutase